MDQFAAANAEAVKNGQLKQAAKTVPDKQNVQTKDQSDSDSDDDKANVEEASESGSDSGSDDDSDDDNEK
jgi:hypothetical protein